MMRQFDQPGRSPVFAENGIAATSHPLASATAIDILREGGSAVDASIAAALVLSVVEPQMTGIGGDCFAIISDPSKGMHAINGSGRSASGANAQWYQDNGFHDIPPHSAHSITVPGALKSWDEMHKKFGKLSWERLFVDAIKLAQDGFAVAPRVALDWAGEVDSLKRHKGASVHYLVKGCAPDIGDRVAFPALAKTLKSIAKKGIDAFYLGDIAQEIAQTVQAEGGFLEEEDLAGVSADWVTPISTEFAGHNVLEIPPNGQGMVTLIMLNLMELFNVNDLPHDSAERYHLEIEIGRVAYSVRDVMLADPDHMTMSAEQLTSIKFAKSLMPQIQRLKRNNDIKLPDLPSSDTVYLTIADRDGQIISFIYSIYSAFGSQISTLKSGILLQNRGACFNTKIGHPNAIGPSKRPLHTIIPAFSIKDGKSSYSFGVMGGAYQPMGQSHVFGNLVSHGMDPQEALDHPRLFWDADGVVEYESGISKSIIAGLEARGHPMKATKSALGGGQIIHINHDTGFYCAGSDPRKDGLAIGY